MSLRYEEARKLLNAVFEQVEGDLLQGQVREAPEGFGEAFDAIFRSGTQAYREVLIGCAIARIQDQSINIRLPYVKQGPLAFNGRTLDEKVVNPFLHDQRIPSSRGPYLNVFRRSVRLDQSARGGVRDTAGYDALLTLISYLEGTDDSGKLSAFLNYLLYRFARLREASLVPLSRLQRISLQQYDTLVSGLLEIPSGGRLPVLLVVAMFNTLKDLFELDWDVTFQGINVADAAAGAGGDITISAGGRVILAIEVTERPVDRSRVVATFNTKIAPNSIEDYLFVIKLTGLDPAAKTQAHQYFSQGHEVNFVEIKDWLLMTLATVGKKGREKFSLILAKYVDSPDMPRSVKVAWNAQIAKLLE